MAADPDRSAGARVPTDQGLAGLGLLMQLAGSLAAAVVALAMFLLLLATHGRDRQTLWPASA
ncbi:MAG: hypothetical protein M3680_15700 [Myxococcota bacterium]|nr:hypothetical protein [Myxococcota bacterium]